MSESRETPGSSREEVPLPQGSPEQRDSARLKRRDSASMRRRDSGQIEVVSEKRDDGTYEIRLNSKEIELTEPISRPHSPSQEPPKRRGRGKERGPITGLAVVVLLFGALAYLFFVSPNRRTAEHEEAEGPTSEEGGESAPVELENAPGNLIRRPRQETISSPQDFINSPRLQVPADRFRERRLETVIPERIGADPHEMRRARDVDAASPVVREPPPSHDPPPDQ